MYIFIMAYRTYIWRQNNTEKNSLNRRIYKVRSSLRKIGVLPPVGTDMNDEQKEIYNTIGCGDFSVWDQYKSKNGHNGGININKVIKTRKTYEELLWWRTKQKTSETKSVFEISVEDIIIPEFCPICGILITTSLDGSQSDNYYVLDKLEWNMGYIKENVRVVSKLGLSQKITQLQLSKYFDDIDNIPKNIEKEICLRSKNNAKKRKCEFNLKPEDIVIPTHCIYLNLKLSFNKKDNKEPFYYSIDRIDSTKGYIKGNVQIISLLANTMKNCATKEQLINFANGILNHHNI